MMDEFYYWMYRGLRRIRKEEDPAFDAFLGVLFFIMLNFAVIGRTFYNITQYSLSHGEVKFWGPILAAIQVILGYLLLYQRRDEIFQKMNQLSDERRKKGRYIFITYIIVSAILFYIVTIFF